jgi:hypothetical protein
MLRNIAGFLLIVGGTALLGLGGYAARISAREGGTVVSVFGLNGWWIVLFGLACYAGAAAFFSLERAKRLAHVGLSIAAEPGAGSLN